MKDDPRACHERQTHGRSKADGPEPSAPAHSDHESRAAYQSHRLQARCVCLLEVRSPTQALKYGAKQCAICAALNADRCATRKLDVNRA